MIYKFIINTITLFYPNNEPAKCFVVFLGEKLQVLLPSGGRSRCHASFLGKLRRVEMDRPLGWRPDLVSVTLSLEIGAIFHNVSPQTFQSREYSIVLYVV